MYEEAGLFVSLQSSMCFGRKRIFLKNYTSKHIHPPLIEAFRVININLIHTDK